METYTTTNNKIPWYHRKPLNIGIVLSLILATFVPLTLLSISLYQTSWNNTWQEVSEKYHLVAKSLSSPISLYISDQRTIAQLIGHNIDRIRDGEKESILQRYLMESVELSHGIRSLTWYENEEKIITSDSRDENQPTISISVYKKIYEKIKASESWQLSSIHKDTKHNELDILLSEPIYDDQDQLKGIIIAMLDPFILQAIRELADFDHNGYAFIINSNGQIISHPFQADASQISNKSNLEMLKELRTDNSGVGEYFSRLDQQMVVAGYASVTGLDWGVIVQQPKQEISAKVQNLIWIQLRWGIIGLCFAIGVAYFLIRWIQTPLKALMESIALLIQNDFKGIISPASKSAPYEIQKLAVTMNMLTTRFQNSKDIIANMNISLQERIDEATQQLNQTNIELEKALIEAKSASEAKGSFLANMSHELRTPMNAIIGYGEILEEEMVDRELPELLPDIKKILSSSQHLLSLINDILDLSKIEAGKMELHLENFSLNTLFEDICESVQPLVAKNENQIRLIENNTNGNIYADQTKLKQIILNLISNSAKFTQKGEIEVILNNVRNNHRQCLEIQIKDNGIGMNEEQLSHVFNEFTQADSSTTKKFGGTGLGLAISEHFCQMMGGEIRVESSLNNGTTFFVTLPVNVVDVTLVN